MFRCKPASLYNGVFLCTCQKIIGTLTHMYGCPLLDGSWYVWPAERKPAVFAKFWFVINCTKTYWVKLRVPAKKSTHVFIASVQGEITLQSAKSIYHRTPQFIRSKKSLFQVRAVNKTWLTGTYLQCCRNLVRNRDFFVETVFVSANTDRCKKTYLPW